MLAIVRRFGHFDDFFIPYKLWSSRREAFFKRAGLPSKAKDVPEYLRARLNASYDAFLAQAHSNPYAKVEDGQWSLATDDAQALSASEKTRLDALKYWLSKHMRSIKLPELLIEVDNELCLTDYFLPPAKQEKRTADDICVVIVTWIAQGCNIGNYTMARLTPGVTYEQIKLITDWQLTEDAQRAALAEVVNAISSLDVTQSWGDGTSSSSDAARFAFQQKVLQQTYSTQFRDFALEFYTFVADNYAPFFSEPIECTDRDAPYALDGVLYNESDLMLQDHYVDTHGYTEINFAGFTMLGYRFNPRIRGVHKQRIYRIDTDKDYGCLTPLIAPRNRLIHMNWICEQWDSMGHFYASFETGHTTASMAMKRLSAFTGKNHFYRANRELGRVIKTENILQHMSDPLLRSKRQRGLLKGEQIHQLARNIAYGKRGKISARNLQEQRNTCSCLTLIMACIIYWQAKEIMRVIAACRPQENNIDLKMIKYVSPIEWSNVILYGEYLINKALIKGGARYRSSQ